MHVLVTGGNRGLGLEFVRQYLQRGAHVHACCRHPAQASALNRLAAEHPGHLNVLPLDVSRPASIQALRAGLDLFTDRLDRLVNNAGMLVRGERFGGLDAGEMLRSYQVNAVGPVLLVQACAGLLERGRNARVANITSGLGSISLVDGFHTPSYNASKAALNMWTRLLAQALNPRGVLCFALSPGWVRTDMGGAQAPLSATASVASLIDLFENATADDQASLLDHAGGRMPW